MIVASLRSRTAIITLDRLRLILLAFSKILGHSPLETISVRQIDGLGTNKPSTLHPKCLKNGACMPRSTHLARISRAEAIEAAQRGGLALALDLPDTYLGQRYVTIFYSTMIELITFLDL